MQDHDLKHRQKRLAIECMCTDNTGLAGWSNCRFVCIAPSVCRLRRKLRDCVNMVLRVSTYSGYPDLSTIDAGRYGKDGM